MYTLSEAQDLKHWDFSYLNCPSQVLTWTHAGLGKIPLYAQQSPAVVNWGTGYFENLLKACSCQRAWHQTFHIANERKKKGCCWGWRGWRHYSHFGTWLQRLEQQRCIFHCHSWVLLLVIEQENSRLILKPLCSREEKASHTWKPASLLISVLLLLC